MPSNMTFGVNLLPKLDDTYELGNRGQKWNFYINNINGEPYHPLPSVSSADNGKVLKVVDGQWVAGTLGG